MSFPRIVFKVRQSVTFKTVGGVIIAPIDLKNGSLKNSNYYLFHTTVVSYTYGVFHQV